MKQPRELLETLVESFNQNDASGENNNLAYVVTFIRGPDLDTYDGRLKALTTARVRHKIGITRCSGLVVNDLPLLSIYEVTQGLSGASPKLAWPEHHKMHYEHCLDGLFSLGYITEKEHAALIRKSA